MTKWLMSVEDIPPFLHIDSENVKNVIRDVVKSPIFQPVAD